MKETKKLGIVLNGGGGKGSYQIGVWKYLSEIGLFGFASVYAGSSVGALNAILFASGDYDKALSIWLCDDLKQKILSHTSIHEKIASRSLFGREGLKEIIKSIDLADVKLHKTVYATCSRFSPCLRNRQDRLKGITVCGVETLDRNSPQNIILSLKKELFDIMFSNSAININNLSATEIECVLLASSAIPLIFPKQMVSGTGFYDGGLSDNCPVYPLVQKEHCTDILVLHLNERKRETTYDLPSVHELFPSQSLGSFRTGTLNFSRENAERNIELGYKDARTLYAPMLEGLCEKYAA